LAEDWFWHTLRLNYQEALLEDEQRNSYAGSLRAIAVGFSIASPPTKVVALHPMHITPSHPPLVA
jgi:hypothetical protein